MQIDKNLINKVIAELNIKIIRNLMNNEKFDINEFLKQTIKNCNIDNVDEAFNILICKNIKKIEEEIKEAVVKLRKKYYEILDEYHYFII